MASVSQAAVGKHIQKYKLYYCTQSNNATIKMFRELKHRIKTIVREHKVTHVALG